MIYQILARFTELRDDVPMWAFWVWAAGGLLVGVIIMGAVWAGRRRMLMESLWEAVKKGLPSDWRDENPDATLLDAVDTVAACVDASATMIMSKKDALRTLTADFEKMRGERDAAVDLGKEWREKADGLGCDLEATRTQRNQHADEARELYLKLVAVKARLAKFDRPRDAKGRIISAKAAARKRGK